jgi:hypothetical protein
MKSPAFVLRYRSMNGVFALRYLANGHFHIDGLRRAIAGELREIMQQGRTISPSLQTMRFFGRCFVRPMAV